MARVWRCAQSNVKKTTKQNYSASHDRELGTFIDKFNFVVKHAGKGYYSKPSFFSLPFAAVYFEPKLQSIIAHQNTSNWKFKRLASTVPVSILNSAAK